MSRPSPMTLADIAQQLSGQLYGNPDTTVTGFQTLSQAQAQHITFLDNPKYIAQLHDTKAGVVLLQADWQDKCPTNAIVVKQPRLAFLQLLKAQYPKQTPKPGIHPTAVIHASAQVHESAYIGPHCVIGADSVIGPEAVLVAQVFVGAEVSIGEKSWLDSKVTLYDKSQIGRCVRMQAGVVIGSDGFGYERTQAGWEAFPQIGRVVIEDHVEIGANTTIDCGAIEDTIIKKGAILDNQIQIGHNVVIGERTALAGCVGVAGSTTIGKDCLVGGGSGIGGHITIADGVIISGMGMVASSISKRGVYSSGVPAKPQKQWLKNVNRFHQLDEWVKRIKQLEK